MLFEIYRQPLGVVLLAMFAVLVIWSCGGWYCQNRRRTSRLWRLGNACLSAVSVAAILYTTVLRESSGTRTVILIPLYSIFKGFEEPELYRSMLMNVLLFMPLGLSAANALPERWQKVKRFRMTVACGLFLSILIEGLQFIFALGQVEVDDLLCNTLGVALGAYSLACRHYVPKVRRYVIEHYCEEVDE